jgi:hypothetical protein
MTTPPPDLLARVAEAAKALRPKLYADLRDWIEVTGICPAGCSYEYEMQSFIDDALSAALAANAAEIERRVAAETERCCKAICTYCSEGRELIEHRAVSGRIIGHTHRWFTKWGSEMTSGCQASALRAQQPSPAAVKNPCPQCGREIEQCPH